MSMPVFLCFDECDKPITDVTITHVLYEDRKDIGQTHAVSAFAFFTNALTATLMK
jgi:hypothetical protein